jgi:hypothetical protein
MNVGKLKKLLEHVPDEHIVVLSADEEGNAYRELSFVNTGDYSYGAEENEIYGAEVENDCVVLWP